MSLYRSLIIILISALSFSLSAQGVHDLRSDLDFPLLGAGGITFAFSFDVLRDSPILTEEQIRQLDPLRINGLDRVATRQLHDWAHVTSNITLNTSLLSNFGLLMDRNSRDEAGTIGLMFLEAAFINNAITNIFKGGVRRARPYVYNANADPLLKMEKNARWSFFSGHASNSACYTFFAAKVFSDNNPGSDWNPVVWTAAATLPAATAFLRVKAGKHFPTDVIVGYAVGAAVGFLIPHLHK